MVMFPTVPDDRLCTVSALKSPHLLLEPALLGHGDVLVVGHLCDLIAYRTYSQTRFNLFGDIRK